MRIVAAGFATPDETAAWANTLGYSYEIWTDADQVLALHYDVLVDWEEAPLRHAFVLDGSGTAVLWHEGAVSAGADPEEVLADCRRLFE